MFTDVQAMLCLAGISYRGFQVLGKTPIDYDVLRPALQRGLTELPPLKDGWDIVWGPAQYHGPLSLFDDKSMFVVRDRRAPQRYVIVLRGTNPISASDWLFGDLWTGRVTAWPYGERSGHERVGVSLSSALSQSVLQGLRSPGPRNGPAASIWAHVDRGTAELTRRVVRISEPFRRLTDAVLAPLQRDFLDALMRLNDMHAGLIGHVGVEPLRDCLTLWQSRTRQVAFDILDKLAELTGERTDRLLLALIERDAKTRASLGSGATLQEFLAAAVAESQTPIDVIVVGHSKGGALASTMALWLRETQGEAVAAEERWDPNERATVHCYSYAAPTAGNAAFARRTEQLLGARCHRIWNDLDIVPHAWASDDVVKVPELYLPNIGRNPLVNELVELIVHRTKSLGYAQPGGAVQRLHGELEPRKPEFFLQLAHQHLDAYLTELGLAEHGISQAVLFDQKPFNG